MLALETKGQKSVTPLPGYPGKGAPRSGLRLLPLVYYFQAQSLVIQKSMSLKYEPSSEPLRSPRQSFNRLPSTLSVGIPK